MTTGTKKNRDYSEEWEVEADSTSYEFRVDFIKRNSTDSDDDDPWYDAGSEAYVSVGVNDVNGCCGISVLEGFEWVFPNDEPGLKAWAKSVATEHFVKWVEERRQNFLCHTVKGFELIEEMLKKVGFKQTAKFKNENNTGAEITQWNYTHDKHKVPTKKPSSVKPRSPSVRAKPATR